MGKEKALQSGHEDLRRKEISNAGLHLPRRKWVNVTYPLLSSLPVSKGWLSLPEASPHLVLQGEGNVIKSTPTSNFKPHNLISTSLHFPAEI